MSSPSSNSLVKPPSLASSHLLLSPEFSCVDRASLPSTRTGRHRRCRSYSGNFSPGCASRSRSRLHVERTFPWLHAWKVLPCTPPLRTTTASPPRPFLTETALIPGPLLPLPRGFWLEYWISQSGGAVTRARTPQPGQRRRQHRTPGRPGHRCWIKSSATV